MAIGGVWVVLGATLQCSAQNITWMLCARFIDGVGTGHLNAIVPVWSAEVATHTSRGTWYTHPHTLKFIQQTSAGAFIAFEFTLNIFGVVVAYWLEFGLGFVGDGRSQIRWRFPIAFQIIPISLFMILLFWMPESPRFLVKAGHYNEAKELLERLRSYCDPVSEEQEGNEQAREEYDAIVEAVKRERSYASMNSYWNMFWGKGLSLSAQRHFTAHSLVDRFRKTSYRSQSPVVYLAADRSGVSSSCIPIKKSFHDAHRWVGIAAITVYAPTIFAGAGYSSRKSQWLSGLNTVWIISSQSLQLCDF
ncbi:hypothetical protein C0992_003638 [Termitomyces sp. T32_za158]|nr:hypothetical protein C0992_003638 [Termitomyces sp. T32_za158]